MDFIKAILLSFVEGATEFLPVSSTGHLILVKEYLGFGESAGQSFADTFIVAIQLPAILAVVIYFWDAMCPWRSTDVRAAVSLWMRIMVAFVPAAVTGLLFHAQIERLLLHPVPVAMALIVGGIILIALEWRGMRGRMMHVADIDWQTAFFIGCFQCLGLIPGTSRSAATIIGAMCLGAGRAAAAEFSFFLAVPTMVAATTYKLFKEGLGFNTHQWALLSVGSVGSFLVAYASVAFFMAYIRKHSFSFFGYYRIVLGLLVLGWLLL